MKPPIRLLNLMAASCRLGMLGSSHNLFAQGVDKKKSDRVKLESTQVEVVEVSETAEKCTNQKGALHRLRVLSDSPIDVRIEYQNTRGRWMASAFSGKKRGDEISEFTCYQDSRFKVRANS